ncbi:MAG: hypothetical protein R2684_08505 [Pyrinomonadaceae bacterium]
MDVRILTLVTNTVAGEGPGHSAVAVGSKVYTFEDVGGWLGSNSGWIKIDYDPYLKKNEHRPVLVQYVPTSVGSYVTEYVDKSIANDDDYLGSGVCSQQVSRAVNYSLPKSVDFDPKGFDTPFGVYHCARRLALVSKEEYFWPGKGDINALAWARIVNKLRDDYPDAYANMDLSP